MNATVLQRQNLALQNSLEQKRRDLEELQQKLERTEKRLLTQDSAISVLDRHWEQTEQQAAALLARVQDDQAAAAVGRGITPPVHAASDGAAASQAVPLRPPKMRLPRGIWRT